ncbi:MAG: trypsin-like peptidase domain-containing protein [bacterium]|nr:trypsin-like peptidase domain-containing protein [bacterium]MDT8365758.1 trypsin-like peptidase domain-containing protein [bacterium]
MPRIFSASFRLFQVATAAAIFFLAGFACLAVADSVDSELFALKSTGRAFVRISRDVTPSVVNIRTFRRSSSRRFGPSDRFFGEMFEPFREFFGQDFGREYFGPSDEKMLQVGLGSGVIVKKEGIILTNNHVIEGAEEIRVTLSDRAEVSATVIGSDPRTDIAVLKLPEGNYPVATMGDSDNIEVGEWAIAIGNPFGLGQSVTVGIVSAKGRADVGLADLEDFIQTDAAINPGNSGGPLIDLDGKVIGINTAIFSRSGGYQGIGFAIPSNMASTIMENLLRTGRVVRSDLGLRVQEVTDAILEAFGAGVSQGVIVSEVLEGGVAKDTGIKRGDIITRVKGRIVENVDSFYRISSVLPVGHEVPVVLIRDGLPSTFMVKVGELPARPRDGGVRLQTALGFSVDELTEKLAEQLGYRYERGVLITRIARMSQADKAGLRPGDLIVKINGSPTPDLETFKSKFEAVEWGENVKVSIIREGSELTAKMVLKQ